MQPPPKRRKIAAEESSEDDEPGVLQQPQTEDAGNQGDVLVQVDEEKIDLEAGSDEDELEYSEDRGDGDEDDELMPIKLYRQRENTDPDFNAGYDSSDDDETPLEDLHPKSTAREEFDTIVAAIRELKARFEELGKTQAVTTRKLVKDKQDIHAFQEKDLYKTIKKREKIVAQTNGHVFVVRCPADWLALAQILCDPQYRPCDIIISMWGGAKRNRMCIRGGNSLISPYSGMARTWPSLALELHKTAIVLGDEICNTCMQEQLNPKARERVGHQCLAAAILSIYKGTGEDVLAFLKSRVQISGTTLELLEEFISEFMALSFGVETERLFFTHFETILHLENIASGFCFATNQTILCSRGGITTTVARGRRYNFLNIFSGVREIGGVHKHVYVPAQIDFSRSFKGKDVSTYRGFAVDDDFTRAIRFKDSDGNSKSKLSRGKSMVAGGAGFKNLKPFLGGTAKSGKPYSKGTLTLVANAVWKQVRPLKTSEDRRKEHSERLIYMASIRAYNTMANFLRRVGPVSVAAVIDQLTHLLTGSLPSGELTADMFPVLEFSAGFEVLITKKLNFSAEPLDGNNTGLKRVQQPNLPSLCLASTFGKIGKDLFDKPSLWEPEHQLLANDEMDVLILNQLQTFHAASFHVLPAIDVRQNWWYVSNAIAQGISEQLDSTGRVARFMVCPINLGNAHWACLVLEFGNDFLRPTTYFFDSLGPSEQNLATIKRVLESSNQVAGLDVIDLSLAIQVDGHTCGTWMLEVMKLIMTLRFKGVDLHKDAPEFVNSLKEILGNIKQRHANNIAASQQAAYEEAEAARKKQEEVAASMLQAQQDYSYEGLFNASDPLIDEVDLYGEEDDIEPRRGHNVNFDPFQTYGEQDEFEPTAGDRASSQDPFLRYGEVDEFLEGGDIDEFVHDGEVDEIVHGGEIDPLGEEIDEFLLGEEDPFAGGVVSPELQAIFDELAESKRRQALRRAQQRKRKDPK